MTWRVITGTVLTFFMVVVITYAAINEPARMAAYDANWQGRSIEEGAIIFANNCAPCHGANGQGTPGRAPALNTPTLFDGTREEELNLTIPLRDFIELTIAAGRPIMSAGADYLNPMPTWGQDYGGPLREDQIQNVVNFVMNWEEEALTRPSEPDIIPVGTDLTVELPEGDPVSGEGLFASLGCAACHSLEPDTVVVGPSLYGVADRAATRIDGYDAQQYLHESIVLSKSYVVEGFPDAMPADFGERMDAQQLADLIAFLLTQTE